MERFPQQFRYLESLAAQCDLVGNDDDCRRMVSKMSDVQRQAFINAYAQIVQRSDLAALDEWIESVNSTITAEAGRLLTLLDYMRRSGLVPEHLARVPLVEWDEREIDDLGNEW